MRLERIAAICFGIVITSAAAAAQTASGTSAQGEQPARSVTERTSAAGDARWQRVQTRSESGSRDVVVETFEVRGIEGRLAPAQEIVTETNRTGPNTTQARRDIFGFAPDGRRTPVEATESRWDTLANGGSSAIHTTSAPDLDGRHRVMYRQEERTRSASPGVRETDTTLLVPDLDKTLHATERTESTERLITPGLVRHDSTQLIRDSNGQWQPIEVRRGEARIVDSERMEEETIERRDVNGKLAVGERHVTRRSITNDQEQVVTEVYAPYADGSSPLALSQRIHQTTTGTADGGRSTVEEVESRSSVAPGDPMRVTRRTETTVRPIAPGRWLTERQVFERDVNGQLRAVINETEETAGW
jgi:hypothetical protein